MDSRSQEVNEAAVPDPLAARKAVAEMRLEEALASIEEAQRLIDRAGAGLCSVRGMAKEWKQLGVLYDKVKATWCAVNNRARRLRTGGRLLLDREPDVYELRAACRQPRS
ncbi:MAG: hypothetical protein ACRD1P_08275 [Thermoanaerobaculia bacterium]